jgi:ankyrin repeat protein
MSMSVFKNATKDNVNKFDGDGQTKLMYCAQSKHPGAIKQATGLIDEYSADINLKMDDFETEIHGDTALSFAIKFSNIEMIKLLCSKGATHNYQVRSEYYDNGDYKTGKLVEKIETILELAQRCCNNEEILKLFR